LLESDPIAFYKLEAMFIVATVAEQWALYRSRSDR